MIMTVAARHRLSVANLAYAIQMYANPTCCLDRSILCDVALDKALSPSFSFSFSCFRLSLDYLLAGQLLSLAGVGSKLGYDWWQAADASIELIYMTCSAHFVVAVLSARGQSCNCH